MSIKVLLKEYPYRSIALITSSHALVFQHSPSSNPDNTSVAGYSAHSNASFTSLVDKYGGAPRIMVEFSSLSAIDLHDYKPFAHPCKGTLGLITLGRDVFICLVNGSSHVATLRPGERVERIHTVEFHCLNRPDYDRMLEREVNSYNTNNLDDDSLDYRGILEHPCLALRKLLSGGTFYYSTDFDLTNRLQNRSIESHTFDIDNFNPSFLWNSYMISPLLKFRAHLSSSERIALDESHLLTSAIRGFVETLTIPHSSSFSSSKKVGLPASLTLISRLSCKRAGTRFNARGIDDEGNVANFVETEVLVWDPAGGSTGAGLGFSYCQVRGSVPVFWEQQTGLLPTQQKITLSRSPEAAQPAFDKHFEGLTLKYGVVHVVNLLSATKVGEADLSKRFRYHIRNSPLTGDDIENASVGHGVRGVSGCGEGTLIKATEYDFHAETQGRYENAHAIQKLLQESVEGFGYFVLENPPRCAPRQPCNETPVVILQQEGVFRTNCLDCLDRTNLVQGILSQLAIESFLYHRQDDIAPDFWMKHSTLWADNGDALSKIYAGTGALKSSFTRHGKSSWGGLLADARKSATRMYINKFVDGGRQEAIDMLLGMQLAQESVQLYDPVNDYAQAELLRKAPEYTSTQNIHIHVCTFNVNGRMTGLNEDLSAWLCPASLERQPELVVIGFQEIVELSPQQIMSTDPTRRQLWEKAVLNCLNANPVRCGGDEYILLRSSQLVGAALIIFIKSNVIGNIKNVEGSLKKTGMSGVAGNKGAVAIRMEYANTRLCFVTAHLAAGFSNYEERNRDYKTIAHGLRFQRGRAIEDHDSVIWLGDFNYRIGLPDDRVRKLIEIGDLQILYDNDQLNLQMMSGLTFPYYSEDLLTFDPTYKFDVGKDIYDTSEKARIPAWCDRVLRKGANLKQLSYNSAPLRFSDHRPVYATFQCTVTYIDETVKDKLNRQIYFKRRAEVGGINEKISLDVKASKEEEEDLLVLDEEQGLIPGLPPPSTDSKKWWLDNGNLAHSSLKSPGPDYIFNPNKPLNPFHASMEPDWVNVDLTGTSMSSIGSYHNGYSMPSKTSAPQPTTNLNDSTELSSTHIIDKPLPRKRLPPPFNPGIPPIPPLGIKTICAASSSQISSMPDTSVKKKVLAPPPPVSCYPQHTNDTTSIPTTTTITSSTTPAVDSSTQTPPDAAVAPTGRPSSTENIRSLPQQPSVTLNPPLTLNTSQKPPVPKKPTVLAKPSPQPVTSVPNKLSKPPPPLPTPTPNSTSLDPTFTSSKSIITPIDNTSTRLKKPLPETKLPTPIPTPQSLSSQTPVSTPPPPPMRTAMTTSIPPLATTQVVPSPPQAKPKSAIALATDVTSAAEVENREGVEINSQITDVRKGVAQWESLK